MHLFTTSNERSTFIPSNANPCLLTTDRHDHYHHHNYYSCKAINVAGTSILMTSLAWCLGGDLADLEKKKSCRDELHRLTCAVYVCYPVKIK